MTDKLIKHFYEIGDINHAIKILKEVIPNPLPYKDIIETINKYFYNSLEIQGRLIEIFISLKEYRKAYNNIQNLKKICKSNKKEIIYLESVCIPYIKDDYIYYNKEKVESIYKDILNRNNKPFITFTMTSCKRIELLKKTINSFLNCCTDLYLIDEWFIVDDNSSESDRIEIRQLYPFFKFRFKNELEKGHAISMNIIYQSINSPYIFHLEDDWQFFHKSNYITNCLEVLTENPNIGQCLINKNYMETESDINILGGVYKTTTNGIPFFLHEYFSNATDFTEKYGCGISCYYWKHFSFRPSLIKTSSILHTGSFREDSSHFEKEYSERYYENGYISAFLDSIYCLHIGKLTSEKKQENAYSLNNQIQFEKNDILIKTFVINLDRRQDRWKNFISKSDANFLNFTRFSAIDGDNINPSKRLSYIFRGNDYKLRRGIVGCALSHIKIWIDLLYSKYDYYLILEDDINFCENFKEKFVNIFNLLPIKWDLCFLGHHSKIKNTDTNISVIKTDIKKSFSISFGGTFAYLITKDGAKKLLDFINYRGISNAIDTMQQLACDSIDAYYIFPNLITSVCHVNGFIDSDIQYNNDFIPETYISENDKKDPYMFTLCQNGIYNIDNLIF